jgi:T5orf172 domain
MYVYILHAQVENRVKIGLSINPLSRIREITSIGGITEPQEKIFGPFRNALVIERTAHFLLRNKRISGEWFSCSMDEAIAVVSSVIDNPDMTRAEGARNYSRVRDRLFRHLQEYYQCPREGVQKAVHIDSLSDEELEDQAKRLKQHAQEIKSFIAFRKKDKSVFG